MSTTWAMPDSFFRRLSRAEEVEFRQWARDHDTPEWRAKADILHPVIRAEWAKTDGGSK